MMDQDEFARLTDPFRGELIAHCYRMLGSVHDAEDLVQETYLRAWRSFDGFEGRTSLRRWLYRIATNRCLTALEKGARRPLPSGIGAPSDDPDNPPASALEGAAWLEPVPDALFRTGPDDPATIVAGRGSVRLAFVAAMQNLSARQRAVLILRDVLDWRAAEVAEFLGITTAAVNNLLLRARAQVEEGAGTEEDVVEPSDPLHRATLDRFIEAFHQADMAGLSRLLRDEVVLEMPPSPTWFHGREPVMRFIAAVCPAHSMRMLPTTANGQPAAAAYSLDADGIHRPHSVQVLTATRTGVTRIVAFLDPDLFGLFGLPAALTPVSP
jgi:RNA polymerase sigma-70 factor (ECF subfamily)